MITMLAISTHFYPSYKTIKEEMDKCIPDRIWVTEELAEVSLQALVNHAPNRIISLQNEILETALKSLGILQGELELIQF